MFALSIWFGGLNAVQYDTVQRRLAHDPTLLQARHFTADGPMEEGWQAFQLWESQRDYQRYLSATREVLQELGYPVKLGSWSWPVRQMLPSLPLAAAPIPKSARNG